MEARISAAAVLEVPIDTGDSGASPDAQNVPTWTERGSASQSRGLKRKQEEHELAIKTGVQSAAAVDALLKSVRREIQEDLAYAVGDCTPCPSEATVSKAMVIAHEMALRFNKQTWVDIAGFVASGGRVGVLAHSMETGRRITFYVDETGARAIQTSISQQPVWSSRVSVDDIPSLLEWIAHID